MSEAAKQEGGVERRQPGRRRRRQPEPLGGGRGGVDEQREIGGVCLAGARRGARRRAEHERRDDDRLAPSGPDRHAADVRRLDLGQLAVPGTGEGPAGPVARDARRVRRADHVRALGRLVHPQRDAQVRVRADVLADDAARSLRGEQQVHAQAAAALGDVDDARDEVRDLVRQRRKLVDHDQQARRSFGRAAFEIGEVLRIGGAQELLASLQLGVQRLQRPLREVRVEVGDQPDRVRQAYAVLEGGAALVVDEHERHRVRPVGHRERGHQALQEL
jgi:hypothetical protein